jgi:hypothetical protein
MQLNNREVKTKEAKNVNGEFDPGSG